MASRRNKLSISRHAPQALGQLVDTGQAWISRLRVKALAWILGIALAAIAMVSFVGGAWVPVVGVALAAAAVSVHRIAAGLDRPRCMNCGHDMSDKVVGMHGVPCPKCGSLHHPLPPDATEDTLADLSDDDSVA